MPNDPNRLGIVPTTRTARFPRGDSASAVRGRAAPAAAPDSRGDAARERFAQALYRLLQKEGNGRSWNDDQLLLQYKRLVDGDAALQVTTPEGQKAVAAVRLLARLSPRQIEARERDRPEESRAR